MCDPHRCAALAATTLFLAVPAARSQDCPTTVVETAVLQQGLAAAGAHFGEAVALSGDTLAIGAPDSPSAGGLESAGAAFVFVRAGSGWSEQAVLKAPNQSAFDLFGNAVALDGDTLVAGMRGDDPAGSSAGSAFIYERTGTQWTLAQKVAVGGENTALGWSVALDGDTLVIGAPGKQNPLLVRTGAVYVYVRSGTTWVQQAELFAFKGRHNDGFGSSVDVQGDTLVVGVPGDNVVVFGTVVDAGSARVFERSGSTWSETAALSASDMDSVDQLGASVALDGDTILVGVPRDDPGGVIQAGGARVFVRSGSGWVEQASLVSGNLTTLGYFGDSVELDGDRAFVGAPRESGPEVRAGAVYLFARSGGVWTEQSRILASSSAAHDEFGHAVAVSDGRAVIGADLADGGGLLDAGLAYTYDLPSAVVSYCTAGTSASGCRASISAVGTPSATAPSGFVLSVVDVEGAKSGHFYFAANGRRASPWGNGTSYQCVEPPVKRGGPQVAVGTVGACDGAFAEDLNARWTAKPGQNLGAGATAQAQFWYRDPQNTSNQTTSLSDALEYCVAP